MKKGLVTVTRWCTGIYLGYILYVYRYKLDLERR